MTSFQIVSEFEPRGDQPRAIERLVAGIEEKLSMQTLYGVTGSGKTFTMASIVQEIQRPTLVIAHNKTLAAQLYSEFRELFPNNAVEYFVSYYDYYQPEAYVPSSDIYIEKDASINEQIDRMRHSATRSLLERRDVLIVASISCIYGIGSAEAYHGMMLHLQKGEILSRQKLLRKLVDLRYSRNDIDFHRGTFRVRGDVVEIFPAHEEERAIRLEFWDDEIEMIRAIDPVRGKVISDLDGVGIYPNSHYVTFPEQLKQAIRSIQDELQLQLQVFKDAGRLLEHQRLEERTMQDLEMLEQMGYCNGIENYSRHFTGRNPGEPPPCLLDYFPDDYVLFIDESHVSLPQSRGMYLGDRSRKSTLIEHGFRLPSALDNRPLKFEEFENKMGSTIFVSATPGPYESEKSSNIVEQIIRPTGLLDPEIEVRPVKGQVDDLLEEIQKRIKEGERVLVTTLTKRMSEKLSEYYQEIGLRVRYLHSDIDTLERVRLLNDLRKGVYDVLIGINLLREGLDLPEVSLVAILDADQQGFLRSARSLIQTAGRAARHLEGRVIMYADKITDAMQTCMEITKRQREMQMAYNEQFGITPESVKKQLPGWNPEEEDELIEELAKAAEEDAPYYTPESLKEEMNKVEKSMLRASEKLEFEEAARHRDRLATLKKLYGSIFS